MYVEKARYRRFTRVKYTKWKQCFRSSVQFGYPRIEILYLTRDIFLFSTNCGKITANFHLKSHGIWVGVLVVVVDSHLFQCGSGSSIFCPCRFGSGSRGLRSKKSYRWKNVFFWSKKCNSLILRPPLRTSKLQEKPSALKREHPVLQYMKFPNYFSFVCLPGSGSGFRIWINWPDWIRIRNTGLFPALSEPP